MKRKHHHRVSRDVVFHNIRVIVHPVFCENAAGRSGSGQRGPVYLSSAKFRSRCIHGVLLPSPSPLVLSFSDHMP